ncbi:MAG: hypothetical protein M1816_003660 [Peltula sp. TS41687]|nr:MAG: hypothetical protein M1816_003660 [Peltula sp. TS41687]
MSAQGYYNNQGYGQPQYPPQTYYNSGPGYQQGPPMQYAQGPPPPPQQVVVKRQKDRGFLGAWYVLVFALTLTCGASSQIMSMRYVLPRSAAASSVKRAANVVRIAPNAVATSASLSSWGIGSPRDGVRRRENNHRREEFSDDMGGIPLLDSRLRGEGVFWLLVIMN